GYRDDRGLCSCPTRRSSDLCAGAMLVALTLARLAARTTRTGGPYAYVHDAFGDLVGFVNVWGYWTTYWAGIAAVAVAFAGYLTVDRKSTRLNSSHVKISYAV